MSDRFEADSPTAEVQAARKAKQLVLDDYNLVHASVQIDAAMVRHQSQGVCWCDKCERKAPAPTVVHNKRITVKNVRHEPVPTDGSPVLPRAPLRTNLPRTTPPGVRLSPFLLRVIR